MYFRYDDNENYDDELVYYPCENCPLNQMGYRDPDGQNKPPSGVFPGQGGQFPQPPGQGGQFPPYGGPGYGQGYGMPSSPPPYYTPQKKQFQQYAVSPGSIRRCMFRYVYIWLDNGRSFWAWITRVDRRTVSGWRWNGRRWVYFGVDLRRIDYFECR